MSPRSNRRRRMPRSTGLLRLLRGGSNRRVRATREADTSEADSGTKERPRDAGKADPAASSAAWRERLRGAGRRASQLGLLALKTAALAVILAATAFGGYHGYRRLAASTYFDIDTIEVHGARRLSAGSVQRLLRQARGQAIFRVDTARLERLLDQQPWIRAASVRRRFPRTLEVKLVEQRARAAALLSHLYLVNAEGEVFKRAEADEAEALPVITGITRASYLKQPAKMQQQTRQALAAIDEYYRQVRPPLSEVHLGKDGELTLLLRRGGVALRFGKRFGRERLRKLDAVLAALGPRALGAALDEEGRGGTSGTVRAIYLDNEVHPERVVVRTMKD